LFAHLFKQNVSKRYSTPATPEAAREIKPPSNYAKRQCHAEGEPRESVLTLNAVKRKDRVIGVRVFPDVHG
jgi:hypothetical protein